MMQDAPMLSILRQTIATWPFFHSFKMDSPELWDEIYNKVSYQQISFHPLSMDFQKTYHLEFDPSLVDLSFIFKDQGKPIGLWQLSTSQFENSYNFSSLGLPMQIPLISILDDKVVGRLANEWINLIKKLCRIVSIYDLKILSPFLGERTPGLNQWVSSILKAGAKIEMKYNLFVNLNLDYLQIKSYFRSSYKPLITKGLKLWKSEIITEYFSSDWDQFRELHISVAGKETRSRKTWDAQAETLKFRAGFLIFLRDSSNKLVGGAFFRHSKHEGRYDTAAYDRQLFDLPLGHVVQWLAIEEFKRRSVEWYYIGEYLNRSDVRNYSEKEINISLFKSGFATHIIPRYQIKLNLQGMISE